MYIAKYTHTTLYAQTIDTLIIQPKVQVLIKDSNRQL